VFQCDYHIVIPTKYRRKIINESVKAFILGRIREIEEHYPELMFKQVNTDEDHVHLLVSIPPITDKVTGLQVIFKNAQCNITLDCQNPTLY